MKAIFKVLYHFLIKALTLLLNIFVSTTLDETKSSVNLVLYNQYSDVYEKMIYIIAVIKSLNRIFKFDIICL